MKTFGGETGYQKRLEARRRNPKSSASPTSGNNKRNMVVPTNYKDSDILKSHEKAKELHLYDDFS